MGLFSSFSEQPPTVGNQLAEYCFSIRQEMHLIDDYIFSHTETPATIKRLNFSKDIIIPHIATLVVNMRILDSKRRIQTNDQMLAHYLSLLPISPTSIISDCLVCEDELKAIGQIVSPGITPSELLESSISTIGLLGLMSNYRSKQFQRDLLEGSILNEKKAGIMLLFPVAQTLLSQVRGVPRHSIAYSDALDFCIGLQFPFSKMYIFSEGFLK